MARLERVFIDASELFPCTIMDVLLTRRRQAGIESFTRAADSKKNPPMAAAELTDRIASAGGPRFAEQVGSYLIG